MGDADEVGQHPGGRSWNEQMIDGVKCAHGQLELVVTSCGEMNEKEDFTENIL